MVARALCPHMIQAYTTASLPFSISNADDCHDDGDDDVLGMPVQNDTFALCLPKEAQEDAAKIAGRCLPNLKFLSFHHGKPALGSIIHLASCK